MNDMELSALNLNEFLEKNQGYRILKRGKDAVVIQLSSGELLKILDHELLEMLFYTGFDLEERLNEVNNLTGFTNFSLPTRKLECNGIVNSYTMPYIPGVDFTDYYENIFDLLSYAKIHAQIENNIKEGNKYGIVFPDLCTTENIRVTEEGKVVFIDYDGLQIKNMPAVGFSDFLGTPEEVLKSKYYDFKTGLFTKEIDIKSAIFLYFVDVFGINLASVNRINPQNGQRITLDKIFSIINLQDANIQQKVWKVFQSSIPNEFLGEDLYRLAERYRLVALYPNAEIKRLVKK
ncbi:MAG TPA: hypothetical protein IAB56_04625 [Candidatus Scybalousia intestinigallinarum]|nr:hypothetical protein [Candidatus Scybalousia intestinigallinarum]